MNGETVSASGSVDEPLIRQELRHRRIVVGGMPYYYHVHLHMPCNQRCIMCVPNGRHPDASLPFDEFTRLFHMIRRHAGHITLIGGEPLLYPRIHDVLELLARHRIAVTINTNATVLDERLSKALCDLGELHLKCSIDAASRGLYRRIRGTDAFDKVTANIRRFAADAAGLAHIKVILVYVVMRENLDDVLPFVDYFGHNAVERIEFHPVRHVGSWVVDNRTGWTFRGAEQVCESFPARYNKVMEQARRRCGALGVDIETHPLPES